MNAVPLRFSEAELRLCDYLKSVGYNPSVIYDIGASNGGWSKTMSDVFPDATYHLFEPLADALDSYRELLVKLLPTKPNFHLHKIGLGETDSRQEMAIFEGGVGSTFLEIERMKQSIDVMKEKNRLQGIAAFDVRRLDSYVPETKLPLPNIVKMDTQGFEVTIFNGGQKTIQSADILILESWLYRGYGASTPLLHELIDVVTPHGFVLAEFGDIYWSPTRQLTAIDAIFMSKTFLERMAPALNSKSWRMWH